jgi:hypothetical protein
MPRTAGLATSCTPTHAQVLDSHADHAHAVYTHTVPTHDVLVHALYVNRCKKNHQAVGFLKDNMLLS